MTWPVESPPCCSNRACLAPAACTIEDEPFCIECADELVDRLYAIAANPSLREELPPLWEL